MEWGRRLHFPEFLLDDWFERNGRRREEGVRDMGEEERLGDRVRRLRQGLADRAHIAKLSLGKVPVVPAAAPHTAECGGQKHVTCDEPGVEPRVEDLFQERHVVLVLGPFSLLAPDEVEEREERQIPPAASSHLTPREQLLERVEQMVLPPELEPLFLAAR